MGWTMFLAFGGNFFFYPGAWWLPPFPEVKAQAIPSGCALGCGWLLSAEAAAWVREGHRKVLAAMPFGCLPGHIYARGVYARLQRSLPEGLILGVDYDASMREGTVENRLRMLLDTEAGGS